MNMHKYKVLENLNILMIWAETHIAHVSISFSAKKTPKTYL